MTITVQLTTVTGVSAGGNAVRAKLATLGLPTVPRLHETLFYDGVEYTVDHVAWITDDEAGPWVRLTLRERMGL